MCHRWMTSLRGGRHLSCQLFQSFCYEYCIRAWILFLRRSDRRRVLSRGKEETKLAITRDQIQRVSVRFLMQRKFPQKTSRSIRWSVSDKEVWKSFNSLVITVYVSIADLRQGYYGRDAFFGCVSFDRLNNFGESNGKVRVRSAVLSST